MGIPSPMPPVEFVDFPGVGRRFTSSARVRFGDTDPHRRLRLDALARLVQDAGNDDLADAGLDPASPWVVRRASVWVPARWPALGEPLTITTFCAGLGARWGERRTTVASPSAVVEVTALWIHLDDDGRPSPLSDAFLDVYGSSTGGRRTSSRLHHPIPVPGPDQATEAATRRPWPLRSSDLDVFGHVNNTALWMPVEDELARRKVVPRFAEIEFRDPVAADDDVVLVTEPYGSGLRVWITAGGDTRASAHLAV
ncbi:MAG TPA: acyl-ACP thioesterase domain-containing protein [Acidimicrobiales bacterium]|nr:acyl-ACP thioesterase domain-containing protein [Acidimicrobiales bacterium]